VLHRASRRPLFTIDPSGARKVSPSFDSVRAAQERPVSSFSKSELETNSDFFERSVEMWDEEWVKPRDDLEPGRAEAKQEQTPD
jgi:hypothetical protein